MILQYLGPLKSFFSLNDGSPEHQSAFAATRITNTLVTAPRIPGDYSFCEPVPHMIEYVRNLHKQGHYIIIHTARRMQTHVGNVGAVVSDIGKLTMPQLEVNKVPYDELLFSKPHADFYVDERQSSPGTC